MRTEYKCINNCKLPPRKKVLVEENGKWRYGYNDFKYCPVCGEMMPTTRKIVERFFSVYHLNPNLKKAEQLIYKSEFSAAAREAFVAVETELRQKSGLDLHGVDLVNKALSFDVDKKGGQITKKPLIAINKLETDSERNEQEGIRLMLMGFFQGMRNIFQHNQVGSGASDVLTIILQASFFMNSLSGHSITKKGRWIKHKIDYNKVYKNMPNVLDRIKLKLELILRMMLSGKLYFYNKRNNYNDIT